MHKKVAAIAGATALGLAGQTGAYEATANVTFDWATSGVATGWNSASPHGITTISNSTYFTSLTGAGNTRNSSQYYNPDFATATFHVIGSCDDMSGGPTDFRAQYACKVDAPGVFPVSDAGPGGSASGTLTATDSTLTGTLTLNNTSDEGAGPQPGTTAAALNLRSADGSPFKNVWYGLSSSAQLIVDLTGTFTETDWNINGGTVRVSDAALQCAAADFSGVLCSAGQLGDGQGSFLSWGDDPRPGGGGTPGDIKEIQIYNIPGTVLLETLSGVLADLSIDGSGNITTIAGEIRQGNDGSSCVDQVRFDGTSLFCGSIQAANLNITGSVVPIPAAAWLFGSALGLLGWIRKRYSA